MRSVPSYRAQSPALVLLVDDNQDGVVARRSVLEELGYRVIAANSGRDALERVVEHDFDLIVTDYRMQPMNGLEFISDLRKRGFGKPIILLTGYADSLGLHEEKSGANFVIQKSAKEIDQLVRAAKRLLATPKKPPASVQPKKNSKAISK